ncbi:hypothetical protein GEOBRER4_n2777 [Citrifermentans bremense]|uniref:Uncharacterized protein n=3 Tax=Citrifermentans bremense TaxID=60035 RepID=A0A7R7FSC9_9BACT|nr:hypothetical protein GEOBRER4_n2777 [Citrifermentans bremense]
MSEEMKKAAPHQKSDQELKEWNAALDREMVQLRLLRRSAYPAGNFTTLLVWQEVVLEMGAAFKEWDAPDAQEWLKGAWEKVAAAGQATYQDDLEYTEVVLRLIALFDFYREFSDLFADGCGIPKEETVAHALKLEKQNVMLLIGKHGAYDAFFREGFAEDPFSTAPFRTYARVIFQKRYKGFS